ncbi:MAG: hypothetical protein KA956_08960 [Pyrinomonadaceae bacterium]|nr:hypothetical protein [Acidobacteriota bacterium]MBK7932944.1 hypothetical protein [Acidobacteriota bacterium]MBP7376595.1 hypothetical protein [Pyrinomonadaceae bacterium]
MTTERDERAWISDRIERGRTDQVFDVPALPNWENVLLEGDFRPLQ